MTADFLGIGWRFPIGLDARGTQIAQAPYEESVRQAIWIILGTARGERVLRPDFGCGIHDLVFAVNNATTAGLAAQAVGQALILWEPRIDVLDVQVTPKPDEANALLIRIDYRVRSTNTRFNLVYPFYLDGSES